MTTTKDRLEGLERLDIWGCIISAIVSSWRVVLLSIAILRWKVLSGMLRMKCMSAIAQGNRREPASAFRRVGVCVPLSGFRHLWRLCGTAASEAVAPFETQSICRLMNGVEGASISFSIIVLTKLASRLLLLPFYRLSHD